MCVCQSETESVFMSEREGEITAYDNMTNFSESFVFIEITQIHYHHHSHHSVYHALKC